MSLTASMWTSVSGLLAHGEKMNVIGNNISNVNTVGFKNQRMDFQDFVYQHIGTAAGMGQVGRGTNIGIIMNDFSQGSLETTTNSTDIAIAGNGFFQVKPLTNNVSYYTRAGNFRFNKDGYLVDPHGYVLQGWAIDKSSQYNIDPARTGTGKLGAGSPVDICLDTFTCPPRHTTEMTVPVNLRNDKVAATDDKSTSVDGDAFFALLKHWDATQQPPLGDSAYAYQTTMEVYDEAGKMHKLTIYFDRVANNNPAQVDGYSDSESYWEYVVTMDPSEDMRDFSSKYNPNMVEATNPDVPDKLKGLLGAGTLTFTSSGALKDMSAFVPHTDGSDTDHWWQPDGSGGVEVNLDKWIAAPISQDGFPMFAPNFSGSAGLSTAYQDGVWTQPNELASGRLIALDLGLRSNANQWNFAGDPNGVTPANYVDTAGNVTNLVKASGLTQTYDAQKMENGRYVWTSSDGYTTTSATQTPPSGIWGASPVGSNATAYYVQFNLNAGSTITGSTDTGINLALGTDNPSVTFVAASNPDNALQHRYTTTNGIVAINTRPSDSAAIQSPTQVNQTWTYLRTNAGGQDIWENADGSMTLRIPGGLLPTNSTSNAVTTFLQNQGWSNPAAIANSDPLGTGVEYYWTGNIAGETQKIPVTTTTAAAPALSGTTLMGTNATEFYWADVTNPTTRATTTAAADPNPGAWPNTSIPFAPTAPTGTWTAQMESVTRSNKYFANGLDGFGELQVTNTTNLGDNFYEHNGMKQDGYTYGDLRYVSVATDGVLSAAYSNGVTLQLYQIVLHDFPSTQNLRREGGNLFTETRESGAPSSGAAGTGTFGTTQGSSLEQSNVDLSREFVNMITTQRGFQANSKTITTVDTMLETVISMKR
ncbi:flagellar hook-basal body complex protein [Desulfovibrio sp. OttesenSCG-928-G11]|nr:flagellar hook-basal body complex protein [Desulfovibrio sp. OttesenSCG-928-G11]